MALAMTAEPAVSLERFANLLAKPTLLAIDDFI